MTPAARESRFTLNEPEGKPAAVSVLRDGLLHGETLLYANGRMSARLHFEAGVQSGPATYYDEAGKVILCSNYLAGKLHGEQHFYDSNEKLSRLSTYKGGLLHGKMIDYYPTGAIRETSRYLENLCDGEVLQYDPDGKLVNKTCFSEGLQVPCRAADIAFKMTGGR